MKIVTLSEAREKGLKYYFTGKPCVRGHIHKRYAKKRSCVLCVREDSYERSLTSKVKEQNQSFKKTKYYKEQQKIYKKETGASAKESKRVSMLRENEPERFRKRDRKYRIKYIEKRRDYNKKWTSENQMIVSVRNALRRIEGKSIFGSLIKYEKKLGYTQDEFIKRIESTFSKGMSWENRSEWHIDHIKPIKAFIDEGVYDLKVIHALSNLQALWASDNQSKGAKYND